jgi:flagellar hook-basal body complex protein FliE
MSDIRIDDVLQQMRALAKTADGGFDKVIKKGQQVNFGQLLKQTIDNVNANQQHAVQLAEAFERGEAQVNVAEVMLAMQKSNLTFQALTQVRNHLLTAYKEIMNMQV